MLPFRIGLVVVLLMAASTALAQPLEAYLTGGAGRWVHNTGSSGALMVGASGVEWLPTPLFGIAGEGGLRTWGSVTSHDWTALGGMTFR